MRQVNIRTLKNNLSKELLNLPVEITKNGKIVATIVENSGENSGKVQKPTEMVKKQLADIISKDLKDGILKAQIPTDGRVDYYGAIPFRPCPKTGKK